MASNGFTVMGAAVFITMVLAMSMGAAAQAPAPGPNPDSGVSDGLLPSFIATTLVGLVAFVAGGRYL